MFDVLRGWLKRRRGSDADFKILADNSLDVIIRCDSDAIATYASPAIVRLLGIGPDALIGRSHLAFVLPEDRPVLDEVLARHRAGQTEASATFRMRRKDGSIVWVEGSGRSLEPGNAAADHVVVLRDITERKAREARLEALAMTDPLTGLANRRAFDAALTTEWLRTQREGTMLSLLLLDVDCFKAFNDHYGHQTGDDCLRAVAASIGQQLRRPGDLAARYGGEEMAIILPQAESAAAVTIAGAVRAGVEALRIPHAHTTVDARLVTVSIGCATTVARPGGSVQMPAALLRAADAALYRAKAAGRNRIDTALLLTASDAR